MRVDEEETVLTYLNGASDREQKYHRHKDSYFQGENNKLHGMRLRKLSMVIFLNEDLNQSQTSTKEQMGMLRLYTKSDSVDGIVDISPRIGRAVLFKSEEMMHQVISSQE